MQGVCSLDFCGRPTRSTYFKLCSGHQTQKQRGKAFTPIKERKNNYAVDGMKNCPMCDQSKSTGSFHNNKSTADGLCTYCKPCSSQYEKDRWHLRKPVSQARYYKQTYNLTPTDVESLLASQGGVCAICSEEPKRAVVDHCHDSGKVRGILCDTCNRSLGLLKDNVEVLMSAAAYLIQHQDVLTTVGGE